MPRTRIRNPGSVSGILEVFSVAKLAIVTRLHAAIMASLSGCRTLPVAYQPKVGNVLAEQCVVDHVVILDDLVAPDFDAKSSLSLVCRGNNTESQVQVARLSALAITQSLLKEKLGPELS